MIYSLLYWRFAICAIELHGWLVRDTGSADPDGGSTSADIIYLLVNHDFLLNSLRCSWEVP